MFLPNINMQNLLGDIAVNFSFQLHYRDPLHLISWVLISALRHTSNKHLFPLIWTTRNMEPRLSVFPVVILSTHYLRAWRVKTFLSSACCCIYLRRYLLRPLVSCRLWPGDPSCCCVSRVRVVLSSRGLSPYLTPPCAQIWNYGPNFGQHN